MIHARGVLSKIVNDSIWYILRTKPRAEKKLQSYLMAWHVWNVLPSYIKVRKVQRRTVKTEMPLFPGYVLARLNDEERLRVIKTNTVVVMQPLTNARAVLRQLHQVIKAAKETEELRIVAPTETGDKVKIVQGPMKGMEGRVTVVDGKSLLTLNLDAFGGAIEVQVSTADCIAA